MLPHQILTLAGLLPLIIKCDAQNVWSLGSGVTTEKSDHELFACQLVVLVLTTTVPNVVWPTLRMADCMETKLLLLLCEKTRQTSPRGLPAMEGCKRQVSGPPSKSPASSNVACPFGKPPVLTL